MSLASNVGVQSVTELSLSPVYHYQYSSLCDAIDGLAKDKSSYLSLLKLVQGFVWKYYEDKGSSLLLLQTDVTPLVKRYSHTLSDRGYISIPNTPIRSNKPLDIGYDISSVNVGIGGEGWSLPLDIRRIGQRETPSDVALDQLGQLRDHPLLQLLNRLTINSLDSSYSSASFLSRAYALGEMIQVVRLRHGRKVWTRYQAEGEKTPKKGPRRSYGDTYSLIEQSGWKQYDKHPTTGLPYKKYYESIYEQAADDSQIIATQTRKGRAIEIHLSRWNDHLLRSKRGFMMADKPFDLVGCRVLDAQTGERVFELDLFFAIWGQKRRDISTIEAYQAYRGRSHIEGYFRFAKQRLLFEQFQTPVIQHLDNWFVCQILAVWLLYTMRKEVQFVPRKWEQYLPQNKKSILNQQKQKKITPLSLSKTQRAALSLLFSFDQTPFKPQKSNKGRPRRKGEIQPPRKRHPVSKKQTKWYAHQYENS